MGANPCVDMCTNAEVQGLRRATGAGPGIAPGLQHLFSRFMGMHAVFSPLFPSVTNNFEITAKRSFTYRVKRRLKKEEQVFMEIEINTASLCNKISNVMK